MTWTVADGSKGRRWREAVRDGAALRHSLLLETGPDRRFSHLELATPAGLLTLHPERDGTLHGNIVDPRGVRHVVGVPWDADGLVSLAGSVVTSAASAWLLDAGFGVRNEVQVAVLRIDPSLEVRVTTTTRRRIGNGSWQLADGTSLAAAADGLPVLDAAEGWPLEER